MVGRGSVHYSCDFRLFGVNLYAMLPQCVGLLASSWLAGWVARLLTGWLAGWMDGCLAGWLAARFVI